MTADELALASAAVAVAAMLLSSVTVYLACKERRALGREREYLLNQSMEHERIMTLVRRVAQDDALEPEHPAEWNRGYWACQNAVLEALNAGREEGTP